MSVYPVSSWPFFLSRTPGTREEVNSLRLLLLLHGGPGWVLAYEAWGLATRYRVVRRDDLQRMVDALEQSMLRERASQRVTAAQREEIASLRRDIELLEEQKDATTSRTAELAARIDRLLNGLSGRDA